MTWLLRTAFHPLCSLELLSLSSCPTAYVQLNRQLLVPLCQLMVIQTQKSLPCDPTFKLHWYKFRLDLFFTERIGQHWNKLSREAHGPKPVGVQEGFEQYSQIYDLTFKLSCVQSGVELYGPHGPLPTQDIL